MILNERFQDNRIKKKFKFVIKFPRIKLNGKKEKTILVSEVELRAKFSLAKVILTFYILLLTYSLTQNIKKKYIKKWWA